MSNDELMLDVSQAHELKLAFRRNGWTNKDIKTLCEGSVLTDFLKVIEKKAEVKMFDHIIDCNAEPFVPFDWSIEKHKKNGKFVFDPSKISFYLSEKQKCGFITCDDLRNKLSDKLVLNANVLDYLVSHPELIPEDWKKMYIFFWGTIYRDSGNNLVVRYLDWNGTNWNWNSTVLAGGFSQHNYYAAVLSFF